MIRCVQLPLKQLTRWAASVSLFPYDPLGAWKRLPWSGHKKRRRAFLPDEMRAVFAAAAEIDALLKRPFPSCIVFKTLLLTGNRPSAIFKATIGDLQGNRVHLPLGSGKKRNGMAMLPPAFVHELSRYLAPRSSEPKQPLLVSHKGCAIDRLNISDDFKFSMVLAFVRQLWPANELSASIVDPVQVAHLLFKGKPRGFDGVPPKKDSPKWEARQKQIAAVEAIASKISAEVERRLEGHNLYALRKTHVSWARQLVNPDSVKLQVGHAPQDVEERHYLDLVDARLSPQAVWDVLVGKKSLSCGSNSNEPETLRLAMGAENMAHVAAHNDGVQEKTRLDERVSSSQTSDDIELILSGRQDSNLRPLAPQASALAKLRHAPKVCRDLPQRIST